jgi:YVTN family beta-propeller protein
MDRKTSLFSLCVGGIGLTVLAGIGAVPARADGPALPSYQLLTKIAIGGDGGWDYLTVDSGAHRLYVTRSTHVMVIDTEKNTVVGDIPNTPGVHGVAIAPKLGRGYTSNGRENTVTVFDLKSLKELQRVAVGQNPDAILFDAGTKRVFTYNGRSNDITALDAISGKVLGTIPVGGKPEFCATDDKGTIFANIEDTDEIVAVDANLLKVRSRWTINPVDGPSGLTIDKAHHRLFAVGGNELMAVVDTLTGKLLATPAIGKGPDAAVFDPAFNIAISSNGQDGTLTLVGEDSKKALTALGTVATQRGARTMALDTKTHRLYLITASFKQPAPGEAPLARPIMEPNSAVILVYGIDNEGSTPAVKERTKEVPRGL